MKKVAKFEKVSYPIFREALLKQDWIQHTYNACVNVLNKEEADKLMEEFITDWYMNIKLPARATTGSAGYDFYAPCGILIPTGDDSVVIPTGIRCRMEDGYVLSLYPRSGLGFKYRASLDNTVGIIDADYYNSDNEGHIMVKIHCNTEDVHLTKGEAFVQGIFTEFCITEDDAVTATRNGGFGSTSK